ncbi:carbamoyl-phosphate synthase large subunit [Kocuria sp.]|uniref:carbamoyl-phosphate synthase large subunit n=1 Tax=Kocuria sp. TaxID=1871328 RepID=UPI0026DFD2B1|nr:carbamoyl-phosphate synthase large subunit [Kocuria sp.]MDO5618790.1 carbamoyl-phosphate synthase large subunit [Kocuria sp.]
MRVLVTSSRNTFALDMVRKLAEAGHTVFTSDTYDGAIGNHSRYVTAHLVTASPTFETDQFMADINQAIVDHDLDAILPTFEEAFYLAARREELPHNVRLYTGSFEQLARLHDKDTFQGIAAAAGVPAPETTMATDDESLRAATEKYPHYFARAAFSRGGVALLTNTGPLAGNLKITDVHPTPEQPWLVQPFVQGPMVCSYSTLIDGVVTAHSTYRAPEQWAHSTGIEFQAVDSTKTLEYAQKIAREIGPYTGQLSFDYVDNDGDFSIIECNPRTTNGSVLMTAQQLSDGLTKPGSGPSVVAPGKTVELTPAVILEGFREPLRHMPVEIHDLIHGKDLGAGWHDPTAMLWAPASVLHGLKLARGHHEKALAALGGDIVWDGQPITGMSQEAASVLAGLH